MKHTVVVKHFHPSLTLSSHVDVCILSCMMTCFYQVTWYCPSMASAWRRRTTTRSSALYATAAICSGDHRHVGTLFVVNVQCGSKRSPLMFSDIFPKRVGIFSPNFYMPIMRSYPVADPGFAKGQTMASTRSASLNGGGAPAGFRGGPRGQGALKLKAFCPFSCKKMAKS